MCGIVTLLHDPYKAQVEALWRDLEAECGFSRNNPNPRPHFSWQVAEDYDLASLKIALSEIARDKQPFVIRTTGMGIFSGEKPIVYIPVVKDSQLLHFHEMMWERVSKSGYGISPLYAPSNWIPHITLAHDDLIQDKFRCILERIARQEFNWEFSIDNIAYISQQQEEQLYEEEYSCLFQGSELT